MGFLYQTSTSLAEGDLSGCGVFNSSDFYLASGHFLRPLPNLTRKARHGPVPSLRKTDNAQEISACNSSKHQELGKRMQGAKNLQ